VVVVTGTEPSIPGGRRLSFLGGVKIESARNRYHQKEKLFGDTFRADHRGVARASRYIPVLCGIGVLPKELFAEEHDVRHIIKAELFFTGITIRRS